MSLLKRFLGFLLSMLFIISLYLTISSYTIGNLIQKENIKNFIQTQTTEEMASKTCEDYCSGNIDYQKCEAYCNYLDLEYREACKETCLSNISQNPKVKEACVQACLSRFSNESKQYIQKTVDEVYRKKIIDDFSVDDLTMIFKNTILLIILTLIFGLSILLVSEKPISKIGNDLIVVSISLLSLAVIPVFIITPDIPIIELVSNYVSEGLYKQIVSGLVLIAIGMILIVIGKKKGK